MTSSRLHRVSAGYGEAIVDLEHRFASRERPLAGGARPQRHRQDDARQHDHRRHPPARRHDRLRGLRSHRRCPGRACARRHRLGAAGAQHLQVPDRGREPDGGGPSRTLDRGASVRDVSAPEASAAPIWAAICRAANNRCSPSPARSCSIRSSCCSTSPWKAWRRSSSRSFCRRLKRIIREEGMSAIVVEQHAQRILDVTDDAIILDRGAIVHASSSRALIDDPAPLAQHLGITARKQPRSSPPV